MPEDLTNQRPSASFQPVNPVALRSFDNSPQGFPDGIPWSLLISSSAPNESIISCNCGAACACLGCVIHRGSDARNDQPCVNPNSCNACLPCIVNALSAPTPPTTPMGDDVPIPFESLDEWIRIMAERGSFLPPDAGGSMADLTPYDTTTLPQILEPGSMDFSSALPGTVQGNGPPQGRCTCPPGQCRCRGDQSRCQNCRGGRTDAHAVTGFGRERSSLSYAVSGERTPCCEDQGFQQTTPRGSWAGGMTSGAQPFLGLAPVSISRTSSSSSRHSERSSVGSPSSAGEVGSSRPPLVFPKASSMSSLISNSAPGPVGRATGSRSATDVSSLTLSMSQGPFGVGAEELQQEFDPMRTAQFSPYDELYSRPL